MLCGNKHMFADCAFEATMQRLRVSHFQNSCLVEFGLQV